MFSSYSIDHKTYGQASTSKKVAETERMMYNCNWCDIDFESESEVAIHKQLDHYAKLTRVMTKLKRPACTICWRTFKSLAVRDTHVRRNHLFIAKRKTDCRRMDKPIFVCEYCMNIFFNKQLLVFHLQTRHKQQSGMKRWRANCPMCDRSLISASLHQHMEKHAIKSVGTCPICLTKLPDQKSMYKHVANAHQMNFACNFCSHTSALVEELDQHLSSEHGRASSPCTVPLPKVHWYFTNDCRQQKRYSVQWPTNGLCLMNVMRVCLLCQEVCSNRNMKQHLELNHGHNMLDIKDVATKDVVETTIVKPSIGHECCGRQFTSKVLLKHHKFKEHGTMVIQETANAQEVEEIVDFDSEVDFVDDETCYVIKIEEGEKGSNGEDSL